MPPAGEAVAMSQLRRLGSSPVAAHEEEQVEPTVRMRSTVSVSAPGVVVHAALLFSSCLHEFHAFIRRPPRQKERAKSRTVSSP